MNTVFKFYLQAWTLLAVASAAAIGWLWPRRWIWWIGLALLTVAAGLYPAVAGYCKILDRMAPAAPRTLDGMRYMADARHFEQNTHITLAEDYRAIQWMQNNVKGSPVIVEANMPQYHWGSRFSIYTGLPAVVGWGWHQEQQRTFAGRDRVNQRINDVHEFYRTADLQKTNDFLQRYHVEYIILGQLERACYPGPGLEKFKKFKPVYQDGQTVIYQVE